MIKFYILFFSCCLIFALNEGLRYIGISLFSAFSVATLYVVYFELYLPGRSQRYTADLLDVVCYFSGALLFYFFQPGKSVSDVKESKPEKGYSSELKE